MMIMCIQYRCKGCAEHGASLIDLSVADGEMTLDGIEWSFSEEYTEAPPRILGGRTIACYWFAISGGKTHCGWDDLPDWVIEINGGKVRCFKICK